MSGDKLGQLTVIQSMTRTVSARPTCGPWYALESCSGMVHSAAGSSIMGEEHKLGAVRSEFRAHSTEQALRQAVGLWVLV